MTRARPNPVRRQGHPLGLPSAARQIGGYVAAAKLFIPAWLAVALVNMWVGVARAGYTLVQELPILLIVFAVPAAFAIGLVWQLARG